MENQDQANQQSNETPTQNYNMAGSQILNVADPARPTDGANKRYVDANTGGSYVGQVNKTSNFTTNSTSFVDITDLSITGTFAATKRALLLFNGTLNNDTSGAYNSITLTVNGTNVGGSDGLTMNRQEVAAFWQNMSAMYITDALTAGDYTFTAQAKVNAGTVTINGGANNLIFSAIQL